MQNDVTWPPSWISRWPLSSFPEKKIVFFILFHSNTLRGNVYAHIDKLLIIIYSATCKPARNTCLVGIFHQIRKIWLSERPVPFSPRRQIWHEITQKSSILANYDPQNHPRAILFVPIPISSYTKVSMVLTRITSHDCHLRFQDGHHRYFPAKSSNFKIFFHFYTPKGLLMLILIIY